VRNWGDEGYCSSGQERIQPDKPFTFAFRFKRPGATAVTLIPGDRSDPRGQRTTAIDADFLAAGTGWSGPVLIPSEGAVMTFSLPPSAQGDRINGMLHFKWTVSAQIGAPSLIRRPLANFVPRAKADEEEAEFGKILSKMTPQQKASLAESLATPQRRPAVRLASTPRPAAEPPSLQKSPSVISVPDTSRERRENTIQKLVKKASPPQAVQEIEDFSE